MSDLSQFWSGDIALSPNGDLAVATGDTLAQQELLRALFTSPVLNDAAGNPFASPDYTFHATWGAGLGRRIGRPMAPSETRAAILSSIALIAGIAQSPAPNVIVTPFNNGMSVTIQYADAVTGPQPPISFDINS
jgi:hypothetical protein